MSVDAENPTNSIEPTMPSDALTYARYRPVTSEARLEIIRQLWPELSSRTPPNNECDWTAYFNLYSRICNSALVDEGQHTCARNHEDLLQIVEILRTGPTRYDVKAKIRETLMRDQPSEHEEQMLIGSVTLATRILAMINVGPLANEISGQRPVPWNDESFFDAVHSHFNEATDVVTETTTLGPDLTARNIDRVAKIGIVWTDNLVDHLRLVERDKKLCVFHHVSFLKHMKHIQSPMYPKHFAKETLYTLTLLFPSTDRKTKQWLEAEMPADLASTRIDLGLFHVGNFKRGHAFRRLDNYNFWRDRLGALKDAFDEATPPSKALLKALSDRKQGDRWLNSWVATIAIGLTLFFGLVQSVEGAVQVWKAYHPSAD